jgi:hypothetical protein
VRDNTSDPEKSFFIEKTSKLRLFWFRSIAGMASIRGKAGKKI